MSEHEAAEAIRRMALLAALRRLADARDPEVAHSEADAALLRYIGDPAITEAHTVAARWHA